MNKVVIFLLKVVVVFFALRVGVSAIQSGSLFLFLVSIGLFVLFFNIPKILRS